MSSDDWDCVVVVVCIILATLYFGVLIVGGSWL